MQKNKIQERREYVKSVVNQSPNTTEAVRELADELFLSERTIWYDLES
jgi:hypothetical protein